MEITRLSHVTVGLFPFIPHQSSEVPAAYRRVIPLSGGLVTGRVMYFTPKVRNSPFQMIKCEVRDEVLSSVFGGTDVER